MCIIRHSLLGSLAGVYGKRLANIEIVTKGVRAPKAAAQLLELLNRYSAKERKNESHVAV